MSKKDGILRYGLRIGLLAKMVKEYKYRPVRGLSEVLAGLMAEEVMARFSEKMTIVPLPTVGRHVRERGFDHMDLIAKKLARKTGWRRAKLLKRANQAVQVGSDAETRLEQAKTAYRLSPRSVSAAESYLLIDDVATTGASMREAMKILREAGAQKIYGAVLMSGKPE